MAISDLFSVAIYSRRCKRANHSRFVQRSVYADKSGLYTFYAYGDDTFSASGPDKYAAPAVAGLDVAASVRRSEIVDQRAVTAY